MLQRLIESSAKSREVFDIDVDALVEVRNRLLGLLQALGDDLADLRQRNNLRRAGRHAMGRNWDRQPGRWLERSRFFLLRSRRLGVEDVLLDDSPAGTGAPHALEVDAALLGDLARERRDANAT